MSIPLAWTVGMAISLAAAAPALTDDSMLPRRASLRQIARQKLRRAARRPWMSTPLPATPSSADRVWRAPPQPYLVTFGATSASSLAAAQVLVLSSVPPTYKVNAQSQSVLNHLTQDS